MTPPLPPQSCLPAWMTQKRWNNECYRHVSKAVDCYENIITKGFWCISCRPRLPLALTMMWRPGPKHSAVSPPSTTTGLQKSRYDISESDIGSWYPPGMGLVLAPCTQHKNTCFNRKLEYFWLYQISVWPKGHMDTLRSLRPQLFFAKRKKVPVYLASL